MVYDLKDSLDRQQFITRAKALFGKGDAVVELKEKKPRSLNQNSYIHAAMAFFALQTGYSPAEVKEVYFKRTANPDLFLRTKHDTILNTEREFLRSTTELTTEEMSVAIDRFLHWASQVAGIYIPPSDEHIAVQRMQYEVQRNQNLLK